MFVFSVAAIKTQFIMETTTRRPRSNDYRYDDERLRFVIRASGLYASLFARKIGLADPEILHEIQVGRQPLTPAIVRLIHACYPMIDAGWLLTGKMDSE